MAGYGIEALGRTSYLFIVLFGCCGVWCVYREKIEYVWVKVLGGVLLLFSMASFLTALCYLFKKSFLSVNVGGIFGIVVVFRLCEYFNITGTVVILSACLAISIMLLFNTTPFCLFAKTSKNGERQQVVSIKDDTVAETLARVFPVNSFQDVQDEPKKVMKYDDGTQTSFLKESERSFDPGDRVKESHRIYELPSFDLLEKLTPKGYKDDLGQITQRAHDLKNTLDQFHVKSEIKDIQRGPVVTMYELELAPGTKVSKVAGLSDDIAIALKAPSVRVVAPLQGKSSIGVEVPNLQRKTVVFRELFEDAEEMSKKMAIPLLIGKDVAGNPLITDLASMPHLLIAGTTGSGKSVCLNSIILSILFFRHPNEVQLLLVDPKMVEFSLFQEIPHLISPVVTEMKKASAVLQWAVNKMEERYALLASMGVKNISSYNRLGISGIRKHVNRDEDFDLDDIPRSLPHIVIVVDELADLMMVASKEVEASVIRLSQKSRAVGIHLILATQRPSVDVITGLIKSNLPSRISFYVASKVDSRTILDQNGAEKLLGGGDMLFQPPGTSKLVRVQGAFVSDEEVKKVVKYLTRHAKPEYDSELKKWKGASDQDGSLKDALYHEAVRIILETQRGSVSLLQRRLEIGYSRAARLIDMMADDGIVGEYKGSQAREVFLSLEDWEAQMSMMNQEEVDEV